MAIVVAVELTAKMVMLEPSIRSGRMRKGSISKMLFSQRKGLKPAKVPLQSDSMDDSLRNGLWSIFSSFILDNYHSHSIHRSTVRASNLSSLFTQYWHNFYRRPVDNLPNDPHDAFAVIRNWFFAESTLWNDIYDFIEFTINNFPDHDHLSDTFSTSFCESFIRALNRTLERDNAAYRFIDGILSDVTSEEEIEEIEQGINLPEKFRTAAIHIRQALALQSDKKSPDLRNSIKESISAVESVLSTINKKKDTLGSGLKELAKNASLHPALQKAFEALYGWTNDANGIRHAMMDVPTLTKSDARFMLIACSAFVNYLISLENQTT
jgi:hypothetical protein